MAKINELIPRQSFFKIKNIKNMLIINPITIGSYCKACEELGDMDAMLASGKVSEICKITFYFLDEKSKKNFKEKKVRTVNNETGKCETIKLGGYNLMLSLLESEEEVEAITIALLSAMGHSGEDIEKIMDKEKQKIISKKKL